VILYGVTPVAEEPVYALANAENWTDTSPQGDAPAGQFDPLKSRSDCKKVKIPREQAPGIDPGGHAEEFGITTLVRSKLTVPKGPGIVRNAVIGNVDPKGRSFWVPVAPSVKTVGSVGPTDV
jgi:hypothetical protein